MKRNDRDTQPSSPAKAKSAVPPTRSTTADAERCKPGSDAGQSSTDGSGEGAVIVAPTPAGTGSGKDAA